MGRGDGWTSLSFCLLLSDGSLFVHRQRRTFGEHNWKCRSSHNRSRLVCSCWSTCQREQQTLLFLLLPIIADFALSPNDRCSVLPLFFLFCFVAVVVLAVAGVVLCVQETLQIEYLSLPSFSAQSFRRLIISSNTDIQSHERSCWRTDKGYGPFSRYEQRVLNPTIDSLKSDRDTSTFIDEWATSKEMVRRRSVACQENDTVRSSSIATCL